MTRKLPRHMNRAERLIFLPPIRQGQSLFGRTGRVYSVFFRAMADGHLSVNSVANPNRTTDAASPLFVDLQKAVLQ